LQVLRWDENAPDLHRCCVMKTFECKDVGVNCGWKCQGENEQEIIQQVEEHGRKVHGMQQLDPELQERIRSKIKDVQAA